MKTIGLGSKKKQGFTLIEIIIVVVILGILAAVALPKITANIGKATATEAFNVGGEIAKAFDRCVAEMSAGSAVTAAMVQNCDTFAEMNMTTPPITNFTYLISASAAGTAFTFVAKAVANNGLAGGDVVNFTYDGSAGTVVKTCGGAFANMCK